MTFLAAARAPFVQPPPRRCGTDDLHRPLPSTLPGAGFGKRLAAAKADLSAAKAALAAHQDVMARSRYTPEGLAAAQLKLAALERRVDVAQRQVDALEAWRAAAVAVAEDSLRLATSRFTPAGHAEALRHHATLEANLAAARSVAEALAPSPR